MLSTWNDNRRDDNTEIKILSEISNGLKKDLEDIHVNTKGHKYGISACSYWRRVVNNDAFDIDSIQQYYFNLTRDFVSIQNVSGYETLKSKGLEIIKNDSLRFEIISLYEYDFSTLKKFEEEYDEMQFQDSYYKEINNLISPYFNFNKTGNIDSITLPINLNKKNTFLSYLWKIQINRRFILSYYADIEKKVEKLIKNIDIELKS